MAAGEHLLAFGAIALLVATVGCVSDGTGGRASGAGAPALSPTADLFRLVVIHSERARGGDPKDGCEAWFEARIEMADGTPVPEGRWYFEAPRLGEDVVVSEGRWLPFGEVIGLSPGFSSAVFFHLSGLHQDDTSIKRMAIDIPVVEILEGMSEDLKIEQGQEIHRRFGQLYLGIRGTEASIDVVESGDFPPENDVSFFDSSSTRPKEQAWLMTDARGLPLVEAGGGGSSGMMEYQYLTRRTGDGTVVFPVTLRWRIPRKWHVSMQRFVLENVPLGELHE